MPTCAGLWTPEWGGAGAATTESYHAPGQSPTPGTPRSGRQGLEAASAVSQLMPASLRDGPCSAAPLPTAWLRPLLWMSPGPRVGAPVPIYPLPSRGRCPDTACPGSLGLWSVTGVTQPGRVAGGSVMLSCVLYHGDTPHSVLPRREVSATPSGRSVPSLCCGPHLLIPVCPSLSHASLLHVL